MSNKKDRKAVDLGALDGLGNIAPLAGFSDNDSYEHLLGGNGSIVSGKPLELNVDDVLEDEGQLRITFDAEKMKEQRDSMQARIDEGKNPLITPISVKKHPSLEGKWLINDGARRKRNIKELGLKTISVVIDESHDAYDQALANLQREGNTAYELALFCKREVDSGKKPAYVAKRLGKDNSWVTKHLAIVDMPESVMKAYNKEAISSVAAIYELVTNYSKFKEQIDLVCIRAEKGSLTRSEVNRLVAAWKNPTKVVTTEIQVPATTTSIEAQAPATPPATTTSIEAQAPATPPATTTSVEAQAPATPPATTTSIEAQAPATPPATTTSVEAQAPATPPATAPTKKEKPFKCDVVISVGEKFGVMLLDVRPDTGKAWVIFDGSQEPEQVDLGKIVIDQLTEI